MEKIVKILSIRDVTHDVRSYQIEKPEDYRFQPGQATEISIHKDKWQEERRPFTFTSLNEWPFLEFTIKSYHDHKGVTHELSKLKPGDELILERAIDFEKEIKPILISHCSPCHFTGGKMYERLPFDKAETILKAEVQPILLKRIKDEKENELIRKFIEQRKG